MRVIRIGLASSIIEFQDLRKRIVVDFQMHPFLKDTVFQVIDNHIASPFIEPGSSQQAINKAFIQTDLLIFLLGTKLGDRTKEEWKMTFPMNKPTIVLYNPAFESLTLDRLGSDPKANNVHSVAMPDASIPLWIAVLRQETLRLLIE